VRGEEITYGELRERAAEFGGVLEVGPPLTEAEVLARVDRLGEEHRFDDRDVWARLHPAGHELASLETWGALLHGGRVIVTAEPVREPGEVADLVRREGVTVLVQSAEEFAALARAGAAAKDLRSLRYVILAGPEPEAEALQLWRERYGDRRPRVVRAESSWELAIPARL
jgi:non-ribosomal peptide synthetase component F